MEKSDIKYIPLALLGATMGVLEVFVKPFVQDRAETVREIAKASITYYSSSEVATPPNLENSSSNK